MVENEELQQQQQNGQEDSGKEQKKYENVLNQMMGILGTNGHILLKRQKGTNDDIDKAVEEILKEKSESFAKEIQANVKQLIDKYLATEDEINKKEKEFTQLKKQSRKKFVEEGQAILNKIADQSLLFDRYKRTLGRLGKSDETQSDVMTNQDPS